MNIKITPATEKSLKIISKDNDLPIEKVLEIVVEAYMMEYNKTK